MILCVSRSNFYFFLLLSSYNPIFLLWMISVLLGCQSMSRDPHTQRSLHNITYIIIINLFRCILLIPTIFFCFVSQNSSRFDWMWWWCYTHRKRDMCVVCVYRQKQNDCFHSLILSISVSVPFFYIFIIFTSLVIHRPISVADAIYLKTLWVFV